MTQASKLKNNMATWLIYFYCKELKKAWDFVKNIFFFGGGGL